MSELKKGGITLSDIRLGVVCPMANELSTAEEFVSSVLERCRDKDFRSVIFFAVFDNAFGTKLKDMTSGFEMFTRAALQGVVDRGIQSRGHFFQTEIKVYCRNLRVVEVPIHYRVTSRNVNAAVIMDAFRNLFRLFKERLTGNL
jgi:hypothetical protein